MKNLEEMTIGVWYEAEGEDAEGGKSICTGTYPLGKSLQGYADFLGKKLEDLDVYDFIYFGIHLPMEIESGQAKHHIHKIMRQKVTVINVFRTREEAQEARNQFLTNEMENSK